MKRNLLLGFVVLFSGCSTCPQSGFMDRVFKAKNVCGTCAPVGATSCSTCASDFSGGTVIAGAPTAYAPSTGVATITPVPNSGATLVQPNYVMQYPNGTEFTSATEVEGAKKERRGLFGHLRKK